MQNIYQQLTPGALTSEFNIIKRALLVIVTLSMGIAVLIGVLPVDRVDPIVKTLAMGLDGITAILGVAAMAQGYNQGRVTLKSKQLEYITTLLQKELDGEDPTAVAVPVPTTTVNVVNENNPFGETNTTSSETTTGI